ncbi:MAG: ABC transporter ATP-binding protein [Myxococcales bacterium]|nr:ABC transporter ATP-binding protein [Myxococcales bacterium]MDH5307122.1 ABC transporter ATP-binding protein [Myxococcales bacterium]
MTSAGALRPDAPAPRIALRGLTVRFGTRRALDRVDLSLEGPARVGVVGPDGAGKTTLLRALSGLLEVQADEARVLDFDLRGDVRGLKAQLGYVPQVFGLQRELTVFENLSFTARLHGIPSPAFETRAAALLARTALSSFRDRPAGALSGGMKQKLAIINALLPEPALLVLDEPTSGVDVVARAEIWELLELALERGTLVLLSTSYVDEAAGCERLVYLDAGRVVASGTPESLREAMEIELYRVWGDDARTLARAARALAYVREALPGTGWVRVELAAPHSPGAERVVRDLLDLPGARLVETLSLDMQSTLLALARGDAGAGVAEEARR